ncbi:MAG: hypothetical protein Q4C65_15035 [Eubacteriales bacterium]|nr:hypothetical protein [Eubacteriales bacterium]
MKREDVELLREIQKNTEMGLHALEVINNKVYDDSLALQLARESFKYGEIHDRARAQLLAARQTPEPENKVGRLMLSAAIQGNTLFDSSTSHVAELLIRGSNTGLAGLWRSMNRNGQSDGQPVELARELMDFEENNIRELKKYL